MSNAATTYVIELEKWGITSYTPQKWKSDWLVNLGRSGDKSSECRWVTQNDVSNGVLTQESYNEFKDLINSESAIATKTTTGINNALRWAGENGYTEVVLPCGEYLIDKKKHIKLVSNLIFNLGNSILRKESNNIPVNRVILAADTNNSKIINGTILGDRETHDYSPYPMHAGAVINETHEWGHGIVIACGAYFTTIENVRVKDVTGDGIYVGIDTTDNTSQYDVTIQRYILKSNLEIGDYNNKGEKINGNVNGVDTSKKIRTKDKIDVEGLITTRNKKFTVNWHSYFGFGAIGEEVFAIHFYDKDNNYITSYNKMVMYEDIIPPPKTKYVQLSFCRTGIPNGQENDEMIYISQYYIPEYTYISNNVFTNCRRLGIGVCGVKQCYIDNNIIKDTSGTYPQYGIDVEEGYNFNRDIFIKNNHLVNNKNGDLILSAGNNIVIQKNHFTKGLYIWSRASNIKISENYFMRSQVTLGSDDSLKTTIYSAFNVYNGSRLQLSPGTNSYCDTLYNSDLWCKSSTITGAKFTSTSDENSLDLTYLTDDNGNIISDCFFYRAIIRTTGSMEKRKNGSTFNSCKFAHTFVQVNNQLFNNCFIENTSIECFGQVNISFNNNRFISSLVFTPETVYGGMYLNFTNNIFNDTLEGRDACILIQKNLHELILKNNTFNLLPKTKAISIRINQITKSVQTYIANVELWQNSFICKETNSSAFSLGVDMGSTTSELLHVLFALNKEINCNVDSRISKALNYMTLKITDIVN